jgi:hypothetical protein
MLLRNSCPLLITDGKLPESFEKIVLPSTNRRKEAAPEIAHLAHASKQIFRNQLAPHLILPIMYPKTIQNMILREIMTNENAPVVHVDCQKMLAEIGVPSVHNGGNHILLLSNFS